MAFSLDVFQIIFFVLLLGLGSEIALYLWCYSSSSFKSINESIVRLSRKANALKGTPQYYKQRQNKKNDRFEAGLKKEATKELAVLKVKQSVVVSRLSAPIHSFWSCIPNSKYIAYIAGCLWGSGNVLVSDYPVSFRGLFKTHRQSRQGNAQLCVCT